MRKQQQQNTDIIKAALYYRLSKEDGEGEESSSIESQRRQLTRYAQDNDFSVVDEYIDDGYTGTNFDRPEFQRMLSDAQNGKLNCIVTKDLSRLGRNSSDVMTYTDTVFPLLGVRYIAVNDAIDTAGKMAEVTVPILAVVNEMYPRDISKKIRTSMKARMESGQYISPFAPYGYQKDPNDKHRLVADPVSAPIVQELFRMAADGARPGEIADVLNEKKIVTPAVYRCQNRPDLDINNYSRRREWTSTMVCKMLRDEVYLGKLQQGKTQKVSFKSKETKEVPREQWICVEGTHEPLISEDTFRQVRNRSVARRCPPTKGFENVFSGIAKCADCGRSMTLAPSKKKGTIYNLSCGGYKSHGAKECSNHFIGYELLYDTVLEEIRKWFVLTPGEREKIVRAAERQEAERARHKQAGIAPTLEEKKKRRDDVSRMLTNTYEEHFRGTMPDTVYQTLIEKYNAELETLTAQIADLEKQLKADDSKSDTYREFFSLLDEITDVRELSKPLLSKLIDRIEVGQWQYEKDENGNKVKAYGIRIYWRFVGCETEEE